LPDTDDTLDIIKPIDTIAWKDGHVELIDQTRLPHETVYLKPESIEEIWTAIRTLQVRGAPAIGIAAAFGLYLAALSSKAESVAELLADLDKAAAYLRTARPTAVNLFWALERLQQKAASKAAEIKAAAAGKYATARQEKEPEDSGGVTALRQVLLDEALAMMNEDIAVCAAIGAHGITLLRPDMGVLTHCNAGGLATAGWGTALAPLFLAHRRGLPLKVYACETRPLLQGARLTTWELMQEGIDVTLICDNMAGVVMQKKMVQAVIVGADRVAANGDTANKIGTYSLAVLARQHGLPFYVAVPRSTLDLDTPTGAGITIEERPGAEVTSFLGRPVAPPGVKVYNPAFDVTPADLITAFITEVGVLYPPFAPALQAAAAKPFPPYMPNPSD